jgi:Zn-dependent M28 family amino/carboxypeptidase
MNNSRLLHTLRWAVGLLVATVTFSCCTNKKGVVAATEAEATPVVVPVFDADSAYAQVAAQVAFGPRVPGTDAHRACGDWLMSELRRQGAVVTVQEADLKAYNGDILPSRNIIGSYNPDTRKRVLLCAHWDSRPWADADPDPTLRHTPILGANDGASGVGVLLEIARHLHRQAPAIGIDIVFFDSEDYGQHEDDIDYQENTWCLGSQYWARQAQRAGYVARFGILLDMVGAPDARFYRERASKHYASTVVDKVWRTAHALGFGEYFPMADGTFVTDDHLPVNLIAKVPCIDIVPYDEEYGFGEHWHTVNDNLDWISPATLRAVGQTVLHVIYHEK